MKNYKTSTKELFKKIAKRYFSIHSEKYNKSGELKKAYHYHRDFRFLSEYQRAFNVAMAYGNTWRELEAIRNEVFAA